MQIVANCILRRNGIDIEIYMLLQEPFFCVHLVDLQLQPLTPRQVVLFISRAASCTASDANYVLSFVTMTIALFFCYIYSCSSTGCYGFIMSSATAGMNCRWQRIYHIITWTRAHRRKCINLMTSHLQRTCTKNVLACNILIHFCSRHIYVFMEQANGEQC